MNIHKIKQQILELENLFENEDYNSDIENLKSQLQSMINLNIEGDILKNDFDNNTFRCRVFFSEHLFPKYHDAIIFEILPEEKVKVLFSHPMTIAMKSCENFLTGADCTEGCRYSHGYIVGRQDMLPYLDPNFEKMIVGSKCLVKNESIQLWTLCEIEFIDIENLTKGVEKISDQVEVSENNVAAYEHAIIVKNVVTNQCFATNLLNIRLLETSDLISDNTSANLSTLPHPTAPFTSDNPVGKKQIGLDLLLKMGFTPGQGLGKYEQGIKEPVQLQKPEILCGGKGMSSRHNKKQQQNLHNLKQAKNKQQTNENLFEKIEIPIFNLLNSPCLTTTSDCNLASTSFKSSSSHKFKRQIQKQNYFDDNVIVNSKNQASHAKNLFHVKPSSASQSSSNNDTDIVAKSNNKRYKIGRISDTPANQPFSTKKNKYIF